VIRIEEVATCQCGTKFWQNAVNQVLCPKCHDKVAKVKKKESRTKMRHERRGYAGVNVRDIAREMERSAKYAMR